MNSERISTYLVVCTLAVVSHPVQGVAQQDADPSKAASQPERDGQHDFDFELGSWKIHLKKLMHPLRGSTKGVEFDGTSLERFGMAARSWSSSKPRARQPATSRA